jgi:toxin ParE1/3/4
VKSAWSRESLADLVAIREYIAADDPGAAARVATAILSTVRRIERFPNSGKRGRVPTTREAPVPGTPYVIVYRFEPERIGIVHVIHGAQDWPPGRPTDD